VAVIRFIVKHETALVASCRPPHSRGRLKLRRLIPPALLNARQSTDQLGDGAVGEAKVFRARDGVCDLLGVKVAEEGDLVEDAIPGSRGVGGVDGVVRIISRSDTEERGAIVVFEDLVKVLDGPVGIQHAPVHP